MTYKQTHMTWQSMTLLMVPSLTKVFKWNRQWNSYQNEGLKPNHLSTSYIYIMYIYIYLFTLAWLTHQVNLLQIFSKCLRENFHNVLISKIIVFIIIWVKPSHFQTKVYILYNLSITFWDFHALHVRHSWPS